LSRYLFDPGTAYHKDAEHKDTQGGSTLLPRPVSNSTGGNQSKMNSTFIDLKQPQQQRRYILSRSVVRIRRSPAGRCDPALWGLSQPPAIGRWDRPELHRALDQLRQGDVLAVWNLDRLSRSLKDLLHILEKITEAEAGFRSLTESIDTTTPAGRMMLQMLEAFAEFERSMVRERTRLGLLAARERGRVGGRLPKLTSHQRAEAIKMVNSGDKSAAEVARLFRVHRSSISRLIAKHALQTAEPVA
jgi:hypothetical protein